VSLILTNGTLSNMHSISLQSSDSSIAVNDILGRIGFAASNETGSDALKVSALILAVAEGTFDANNNPTSLTFSTGHSETATEKMRIDSLGNVGIGTSSPSQKLEVNGIIKSSNLISDSITFGSTDIISGGSNIILSSILNDIILTTFNSAADHIHCTNTSSASRPSVNINPDAGNIDFTVFHDTSNSVPLFHCDADLEKVGINTITPDQVLDVTTYETEGLGVNFQQETAPSSAGGFQSLITESRSSSIITKHLENTSNGSSALVLKNLIRYGTDFVSIDGAYTAGLGVTFDPKFTVNTDSGNVGIDNNNPSTKLHIHEDSNYISENSYAIKISDGNDPETHGMLL